MGIRASYANQEVTISIYGIPVLEEGVKYSLKSTKLKDIDPPAPVYEEDGTVEPGAEKVKSSGSKGSQWETRLVITKNGEVVSQEVDHTVTYKGHAPVILRNTSGTMAPTESSSDGQLIESITDPSNPSAGGPQEGSSSGVVSPDGNGGPGSARVRKQALLPEKLREETAVPLYREEAARRFLRHRGQYRAVQTVREVHRAAGMDQAHRAERARS